MAGLDPLLLGAGLLHLEVEQVFPEQGAGRKTGLRHLQRGGDRRHRALPRRHRVLGLADGVEGAHHRIGEAGEHRRPLVSGCLAAFVGRGQGCLILAAVVEAVLERGPGLQGVGNARVVEVDVARELSLVEDVAEGVHGVIGAAVLAAHPELREEGGAGGADVGLGHPDPLSCGVGVRAVGEGELHGALGGPAVGGHVGGGRGGGGICQHDEETAEIEEEGAWHHGDRHKSCSGGRRAGPERPDARRGRVFRRWSSEPETIAVYHHFQGSSSHRSSTGATLPQGPGG